MDNKFAFETALSQYVAQALDNESSGHDYQHALRVRNNALYLAAFYPGVRKDIIVASSWLHDIEDRKVKEFLKPGTLPPATILEQLHFNRADQKFIANIIANLSFTAAKKGAKEESLEGKIVQDADRLEAIGAIGITRAFAYGATHQRPMFNGSADNPPTLAHFQEKLLLLRDLMNTSEAKEEAGKRHAFMLKFLTECERELNLMPIGDNK